MSKRTKQQLNMRLRTPVNPPKAKPVFSAMVHAVTIKHVHNLRTGLIRVYINGVMAGTTTPWSYTHVGD